MSARDQVDALLKGTGVVLDGPNPWDPQIKNPKVFNQILTQGTLGAGESYVDGWWEVENLTELVVRTARAHKLGALVTTGAFWYFLRGTLFNLQSRARAFEVGEHHYDIGNDLYSAMLDKSLAYSCGYWSGKPAARTLDEAQEAKLDLACRKLRLKKGDRVLDIGCGWGGFLFYAAEKYGVYGVGITVSREQKKLAEQIIAARGLADKIEIRLQDYRDTNDGPYDAIISIEMFEHVGKKNYRAFFAQSRYLLTSDGLFLLQSIICNKAEWHVDPWVEKYIFPNCFLPSPKFIGASIDGVFVLEDVHTFGADYDKTLQTWFQNFDRAWPQLKVKYGEHFYRMWKYYLLSVAGGFRARRLNVWQMVLSPQGIEGGYQSVR